LAIAFFLSAPSKDEMIAEMFAVEKMLKENLTIAV